MKRWTNDEISFLRENYGKIELTRASEFLERTETAIYAKAFIEGIVKKKNQKVSLICPVCKIEFKRAPSLARYKNNYCSRSCYWKPKIQIKCAFCGKEFKTHPFRRKWGVKYCSQECYGKSMERKMEVECKKCGKIFNTMPARVEKYNRGFCSKKCFFGWNSGENHPNWKGGGRAYYGPNWGEQKRKARERDGHICQICDIPENGRQHDVHHIVSFREFGRSRYEDANRLDNLTTLCIPCHMKIEWGG